MSLRPHVLGGRLHAFRRVARAAGRDDVRCRVVSAATERDDMIHRQPSTLAEAVGTSRVVLDLDREPLGSGEIGDLAASLLRTPSLLPKRMSNEILAGQVERCSIALPSLFGTLGVVRAVVSPAVLRVGAFPLERGARGQLHMARPAARRHRVGSASVRVERGSLKCQPATDTSLHCRKITGERPVRG
jgi:hypothetical protein